MRILSNRQKIVYWITVVLSSLLFVLVTSGCSAQWHIKRAVYKDPSVLQNREIRIDTVIFTKPEIARDTFVMLQFDTINDTINGIKYQLIRQVDTFNIEIECPADTIRIDVIKRVPQVKYIPLTWWQRNTWKFLIIAFLLLLFYKHIIK